MKKTNEHIEGLDALAIKLLQGVFMLLIVAVAISTVIIYFE